MTPREVRAVVARLLIGVPLLVAVVWACGDSIARGLLPLFEAVLKFVLPNIGELKLNVTFQSPQYRFIAEVITGNAVVVEGQFVPAGELLRVSIPVYVALVSPLILAVAVLGWSGLTWRGLLLRLLISLPALAVLELIDAPLMLAISINESLPGGGVLSIALASCGDAWVRFLDGGGRYALAIGAGLLVAEIHERMGRRNCTRSDMHVTAPSQ